MDFEAYGSPADEILAIFTIMVFQVLRIVDLTNANWLEMDLWSFFVLCILFQIYPAALYPFSLLNFTGGSTDIMQQRGLCFLSFA